MIKRLLLLVLLCAPLSLLAQQKFGYFSSQAIIPTMPEYTKAQSEVQTMQKQYEDDLKRMQAEFQKKLTEYQAQADSLPENIRTRREQELKELDERLGQTYQDNQQALQKASSEKMQAITKKVLDAVAEIGKADGYIYIMDEGAGIPYISKTLCTDITPKLKAKLGLK